MKIAISARDPIGTGGGTVALETATALKRQGHEVVFLSDRNFQSELFETQCTPFGEALWRWAPRKRSGAILRHFLQLVSYSLFGRIALRRLENRGYVSVDHNLEAFGGDVVVVHNVFSQQFSSDKRSRVRRLAGLMNPVAPLRIARERLVFRSSRVKAIVAVSRQTLNEAAKYIPREKIMASIENGVDLQRFRPLALSEREQRKAELGFAGRRIVVFVGHEFERKRLDLVIGALAELDDSVVLWVIGGRGSNQDSYLQQAHKIGVAHRVKFWGTQRHTEQYFQAADVFALPSDYEAWPLVALEALACGVPTLLTDVGGARQIISDGKNGYIVASSVSAVAQRLRDVINRGDDMRASARLSAENYGWDRIAEKYLSLLQRVSSEAGPRE